MFRDALLTFRNVFVTFALHLITFRHDRAPFRYFVCVAFLFYGRCWLGVYSSFLVSACVFYCNCLLVFTICAVGALDKSASQTTSDFEHTSRVSYFSKTV